MNRRLLPTCALVLPLSLSACGQRREPPPALGTISLPAIEPWGGHPHGVIISTTNVRLHTTLPDNELRRRLPILLEHELESFLALSPGTKPQLHATFFATATEWRDAVRERTLINLGSGLDRGALTISGESLLFDIGSRDVLRLAAHEAWHGFVQRAMRARLPVWLDEALACRAEGLSWDPQTDLPLLEPRDNPTRKAHLARLIAENRLGSLADHLRANPAMLTDNGRALNDYYARAWVLGLLLTQTDPTLAQHLRAALADARTGNLAQGGDEPARAESLLSTPIDELDRRWRALASRLAAPWH